MDKILSSCFDSPQLKEVARIAIFQHPDWHALDCGTLREEEAIDNFSKRTSFPIQEINRILNIARHSLVPMPESFKLLDNLVKQGYDIYCLTNMHEKSWELIHSRFDFWDKFKGVVVSCTLKIGKPDPRIFEYLLSTFHLNREQTVFIDDHKNNIEAAVEFGIHGILFQSPEHCRKKIEELIPN